MRITKCSGVWMDDAKANLIEFTAEPIETKTIQSTFAHHIKESNLEKSDYCMH